MSAVDAALKSSAAVLYLRSVQKWDDAVKWNRLRSTASVAGSRAGSSGSTPKTQTTVSPVPATLDSALPITGDYHTWPDWRLWHAVGLCEQRGDGPDGIAWHGSSAGGLPSSGYPGGLGLSRDFWNEFAPIAGVTVTNGAEASPGEQIRVARAGSHDGTRMGGWSSWTSGCVQRTERTL